VRDDEPTSIDALSEYDLDIPLHHQADEAYHASLKFIIRQVNQGLPG
jgi:hypothetical protein